MKLKFFIIFGVVLILISPFLTIFFFEIFPAHIENQTQSGVFLKGAGFLWRDTIWSGEIYITNFLIVPFWVDLEITPGTIVKFKSLGDYKNIEQIGLTASGGTIKAEGTADEMIWFTSNSEDPINGDWRGIYLENSESKFDHVIVEFGEMGIAQFDSSTNVTNSIIRWSNAEGLYAERSIATFQNNTLYGNGYHEIALEQYNEINILDNIIKNGHYPIHNEKTSVNIEGNCIINEVQGISAGMDSNLIVKDNYFVNINGSFFNIYDGSTINKDYLEINYFDNENYECPEFDYEDIKNYELDYIPGDIEDRFLYVYDDEDETRRVLKRIGENLSFGWALEYVGGFLYRFTLGDIKFVKINPETGQYTFLGNDGIMNPRGLTWDGEYFYVNDFSLLKIFKFTIENNNLKVIDSFDIPEKELGGVMGLTTDGDYLYLTSRDLTKVYKLTKEGELIKEISSKGQFGRSIVWTGEAFWATYGDCKGWLCKYNKEGKLIGEIYLPAKDTWALAWDGEYLWTIQRTCEMWNDPKIYQIEILNDSLIRN